MLQKVNRKYNFEQLASANSLSDGGVKKSYETSFTYVHQNFLLGMTIV